MNWKHTKTLFIFVFILVNISLIIIYIDKVNKSHINDSADENAVNFKQEKIEIPDNLPTVKNIKMQLLTARSNDFSSYAKSRSHVTSEDSGQKIKAKLEFNINDDGKASSYRQTAMKTIAPSEGANNDKKQVNTARSAIEALYYNRYLKRNDEVTNIRLGYYTVVKEPNVQVLEANWEVKVKHANEFKTYYVEAISDSPKIIEE